MFVFVLICGFCWLPGDLNARKINDLGFSIRVTRLDGNARKISDLRFASGELAGHLCFRSKLRLYVSMVCVSVVLKARTISDLRFAVGRLGRSLILSS